MSEDRAAAKAERRARRRQSNAFFWGLLLIVFGGVFLLERSGVFPEIYWGQWWPAMVMVLGIARLLRPAHAEHIGNGVTWILMGAWFFAVVYEWHGLTWHNSWPLALVAVGSGMVAKAIALKLMPDDREVQPHA